MTQKKQSAGERYHERSPTYKILADEKPKSRTDADNQESALKT